MCGDLIKCGKLSKACLDSSQSPRVPLSWEIRMFLSSEYREGTSRMPVLQPVSGKKGKGRRSE